MNAGAPRHDRLLELLADRAVQGLSAQEATELELLLSQTTGAGNAAESMELAAAAADLALAGDARDEPLPAELRARVAQQAHARLDAPTLPRSVIASIGRQSKPHRSPAAAIGWLAAAAGIGLAVTAWFVRPAAPPPPGPPTAGRASLLASAADLKQWPWATTGELERSPVTGDVVWSTTRQEGYMTFRGLPPNDAAREQYQLWIFDPAQSDKTPIDGGVFDIRAHEETVVRIDPKLRVTDAILFAITIEKPGGVVVSDRSRLVLVARAG